MENLLASAGQNDMPLLLEKALLLGALGHPGPREETDTEAPRLWERLWGNPKFKATVLDVVKG